MTSIQANDFDLSNFDPMPGFYLLILATAMLQETFGIEKPVARPVNASLSPVGVGHENSVRKFWLPPIAERDITTPYCNFGDMAGADVLTGFIEQQDFHVFSRVTKGHLAAGDFDVLVHKIMPDHARFGCPETAMHNAATGEIRSVQIHVPAICRLAS
jgi:hypothetical protein